MCTLIALFGVNPEVPLVVGANRDEFYARSWAPPGVLGEAPRIVGGRDLAQKGTWLGATEKGLFVGVTNQRVHGAVDATKRSRGELVLDALRAGSVGAACDWLSEVDARQYNPFNVLVGDAGALYVVYARGDAKVTIEALPPGIWVLNNDSIGSHEFPKASRARQLVAPIAQEPWSTLGPGLARALGDHALPAPSDVPDPPAGSPFTREILRSLQALCVHTAPYGTTSATVLALGDGEIRDYRFAAGPPCVTPFVEVDAARTEDGK